MMVTDTLEQLQPVVARSIIEHLRRGSVPVDQVPLFTVGRERWLRIIEDDLTNYIAAGGAKVRFVNGDYGDGKTHFLSVIQHLVQHAGFAVSFVVLTREIPLHKFELVYREIVSAAADLGQRDDICAVIVFGGHEIFSAGDDLPELDTLSTAEAEAAARLCRQAVDALAAVPKPTVAAITEIGRAHV